MTDDLPDLPDMCWPVDVDGCCDDWDAWSVEPDPEADPPVAGVPLYSDALKARAMALAGQTLRMLTGYRVGGCPVTVRPCRQGCVDPTWRTFPVYGSGGGVPWMPVNLGGTWMNVGCGCAGSCGCKVVHEVELNGPASSVQQVKVDGAVLDPSAYRLDTGGRLVRTDGDRWPLCQDLNLPDTEVGTWSVTYTSGATVDGLGAWVAGILACEYVRACTSGNCRLPTGVTQIVRAGVTMTLATGAFPGGMTGIREVDAFIARWNPGGLRSASQVWSPDLARPRTMIVGGGYIPIPPVPDDIDGGSP